MTPKQHGTRTHCLKFKCRHIIELKLGDRTKFKTLDASKKALNPKVETATT
jgi:hypothetical protein